MDTREFLSAVLPPDGVYCVAELSTRARTHFYTTSLTELVKEAEYFSVSNYDTYFALACFKTKGSRTAANADRLRALFLDIDCGPTRKYASKRLGAEALVSFAQAAGLPEPWIVDSGRGIHAYWPLEEALPVAEWKPLAENLKRLCTQYALDIDHTVTADAARVLRVPGTFNRKNPDAPALVKVRFAGGHTPAEVLRLAIERTLEKPVSTDPVAPLNIPGQRLAPTAPSMVRVLENRVTFFKAILDKSVAGNGCAQLTHYLTHAAEDGMEPLWRGLLSIAKVCEDGTKAAKFLSKQHPYPETRMEQKLREIKGPYPCTKFNSESPGICPGCPQWGRITNPLAFGHDVQVDTSEKQVVLPAELPEQPTRTVTRPTPPMGFVYGAKGGVYRVVEGQDADGNPAPTHKMVLPYDLFVVDLLNGGDDGHLVQMLAMRPEGPTSVVFPQRAIVSKDETVKELAQQNIIAAYGSGNDRYLFDYVRGCVGNVSSERKALDLPQSFGWQKDGTFVLNSMVFSPEGERHIPMPKLANIVHLTTPAGSIEEWRRVVTLLIAKKHYDILAMALTAFGAPLMHFSQFKALTYHIGSTGSGTGKSLSLMLAASVWGSDQYILNAKTSAVAQEHRVGSLNSLPLIIDEITETNKDFEWLSAFVMDMTAGIGKDRMKASSNEERKNYTMWRSLMLLASNSHTMDFFSAVRKRASEGHLRRILELKMPRLPEWSVDEQEVLGLLRDNYGHAGRMYTRWLVRNAETAREVYRTVFREMRAELSSTGDERFWIAGIAANIAGGILIGKKYANIIELPMRGITEVLKGMVRSARHIVRSNTRTAEDILNAYTREYYGQFVVVRLNSTTKQLETSFGNGGVTDQTITRSQVKGRVEHDVNPGLVHYYIEEQQMKMWCSSMSYGYDDFRRELEQQLLVTYGKKDMLAKTRGPNMRVSVIKITRKATDVTDDFNEEESAIPVD